MFSLGLRIISKSLSFPLLFSHFHGGLCGWPRFESSCWGIVSLSISSFSRVETPMPESSSEVLLESHPHVKLVVALVLWLGVSWKCFLSVASAGWGVLNVLINCRGACLPDSHFSLSVQFSSVQSLSHVQLFATPWTAAHQASLSITNS